MVGNSQWTPELSRRWDQEIVRYPDPAVEVLSPRFRAYRIGNAAVERLYTGARWAEGPVWFGDLRSLIFSDIPNNRMLRYCEVTGKVTLFRQPSNYSNGNTRDRQGRLLTCEHLTRRVTRTEHDGSLTVLLDRFERQIPQCPKRCGCSFRRRRLVYRSWIWNFGVVRGRASGSRTTHAGLPAGYRNRCSYGGSRRSGQAQRAVLFPGRVAAVHFRQWYLPRPGWTGSHPGLRGNGRPEVAWRPGFRRYGSRSSGWHAD